ncbi:nitrate reductase molybdenum cofactor assembly chaperone [Salmonella enterica subsp. enterica serovar Enteritidis]|uniref:Nitrate reductase molybdenum cofactor assembly chaperone NarJ n=27 Tax=Gammaproteobacteria TaxID=1236 RepID=A0A711ZEI6_SALET|nr:nitrate reductase 2, gamma subunit [Salmonella enterica subsp. enterica serovar Choleraesuis str. SC-B67]EAA9664510.1 nitrate reductase molybdenum cofactor assembly chaperone [Salmonella enterica subsp. enterica serovar Infantis]EAO2815637.1 nitrate reductase molybdenum cofactor assembly chaperone [Salmonella enterica]EAW2184935.1 nitrate reductase molybdenum cofactor assembly chaperone [Salmonella enterica subsp. enterica]EAW5219436.1 nitrate reductase molybdenum cofactor assembly chaperone
MQILKAIGLLMEYPDDELWECRDEALTLIQHDAPMLADLTRELLYAPLLDKQAEWCEVFDRGRATSLLLFEHVHAESRDRGQAMVDLLSQYETVGLQLNCRELPDHLPLYLEYLSVLPEAEAREGLQNIAPILALLGGRLKQRGTPWYQLFDALLKLAGSSLTSDSVTKQIIQESRDDTRQALDAVWEEEQVKFIEDNATTCDSSPLHHYQRRFSQDAAPQYVDVSAGGLIQYLNVFFYDIYPYICATVFFLGSWLRYDYGQYTWRASSSQMLDKRGMVIWSNLFHIGILGIFFGHLFGMLTPHWMYAWFLPIAVKQQMAMILGGVCGVLTLIGGAGLLWRRLTNQRVRATSTTPDIIIMSILLIQCLLGLSTIPFSAQYPDGSEMMKLVGWAQSIVTFRGGSSEMLSGVAFVFRVHLVLGMTIFLLFPFTRLVHVWSAPFEYFTRRYQIVRTRR